ncbi:protein kinase domain-containing protein, partial [Limnofasciculus baicalensis]|nr:serine/threonine protein kinase [Limnofasciculus baicalensis BBK-W-15]
MVCCINPSCPKPQNPDGMKFCQSCGVKIIPLLRSHYRIIKPLGRGGFGKTYVGEDIDKMNEPCVVKQFAPNVQGSWAVNKAVQLFHQEAQQLQDLGSHPQIPTLYAYFEEEGYMYLVQQFIDGDDLLKVLVKEGVWGDREIRKLLLSLLPVLQFIHSRKIIHRDVKPDNIIRGSKGELVLIDFGVSKQLSGTIMTTTMGTTIGSQGYAALEQMEGGEAYPASDLFSLGVTCFHLLSQKHPYSLWIKYGYSWLGNWRQHLPNPVSDDLGRVLDKLLVEDVEQRYQSVDEVLHDLQPPPSPPPQPSVTLASPPPQPSVTL